MSDTHKPRRHGGHHYQGLRCKKWYRVTGNRSTRHRTKQVLRRAQDDDLKNYPHPKLDAFDRWNLD